MHTNAGSPAEKEIHLLDMLIVLARHKWIVIGTPVVTAALALGVSLFITPTFTSIAKIMPPQQQQSSGIAAMLGQLGGLAGAAGGIAGIKNPNDLYVGLLESRTVADALNTQFKLQDRYEQKNGDDTRVALSAHSEIVNGKKDGMITVAVSDKDPQFAADLANAYVEQLTKLTQTIAITEASQRRVFFEKQLNDTKELLANAELALRATQEKTGMIQPDGQIQAIIANAAQLKGTIAAKEVQITAMRTFAAGQNPELLRAQEELRGLQGQLSKLEKSQPSKGGDFMVPTGKIAEAGVEYVRSMRNVKYYEAIFELLAKQFELAKIDEAKDSAIVQVLDKAMPSARKSRPNRALITIVGFLAGCMLGMILVLVREGYRRSRLDPESAHRWRELTTVWRRTPRPTV